MSHFEMRNFFAPCARGMEPLLADELRSLRCRGVRPQRSGVLFTGTVKDAYRACLWSRFASRILLHIADISARDGDDLYAGVVAIPWEEHLSAKTTIAVDTTGVSSTLRNTQFTSVRVKDGIVDRIREVKGLRPSVNANDPDIRINVVVREGQAKISLDLSGRPLHQRQYRTEGQNVVAPMKETLAAAMLIIAGWPKIARKGGALIDPLCGSATLPIEAAFIAGDCAPGLLRKKFGFELWEQHDEEAWSALLVEAKQRREIGFSALPPILASDYDTKALEVASRAIRRAGLERFIQLSKKDITDVRRPEGGSIGLVAMNPPYGERLAQDEYLPDFYATIATTMREHFSGYELAVISPDDRLSYCLAMNPHTKHTLYNGKIEAPVSVYTIGDPEKVSAPASMKGQAERTDHQQTAGQVAASRNIDTSAFENRLRKMAKHYGTWARRAGISCYRVYDADLADFNMAIDIYQGAGPSEGMTWVYVAEYAAPKDVDKKIAGARLWAALEVCAEVFEVQPERVILKRRQQQKGKKQYERLSGGSTSTIVGIVEEAGLDFEINLSDYLDTGIFLDHRPIRAHIRDTVADQSFLNLFAYTGVVSVFAAAGRASETTTVDMSRTYLDAAKRNMARNALNVEPEGGAARVEARLSAYKSQKNYFVQADVLSWLAEPSTLEKTYEVIFCDPPTFSNSKRMEETWDVARDHAELITSIKPLLSASGVLYFSTNKRHFKIDLETLEQDGWSVKDITAQTIPKDFTANKHIHKCYELRRN